jgi:ubiquinone/menaquinone biosynthesis C-methylase UbiE
MVLTVMDKAEYRRMAQVEQTHWWYQATRRLLRQFIVSELREVEQSTPRRFLDAGCGTGATGAWLADFGSVIALDTEVEALNLYCQAHPEAQLIHGDISAIDLSDDFVDAALCVTVLYHGEVTDPGAAVRELARVVKPGGLVCLMEPGVRSLRRSHDQVTHAARRFSRRELETLAANAGLDIIRSTGAYSFLVPPAWLKSRVERNTTSSDLDSNTSGLFGLLGLLARFERRILRVVSLPFGLSVIVVARKKS